MTRINTNTPALQAARQLGKSSERLQLSLERLSSGLRINRGADDPAGLIVSENLRSEINGVQQAVANSQRASNVIATTEGALNEVAALLTDIQSKIIESANTGVVSEDEIRANQLQIDSAIESITRIANTTTFAGRKLLDGSLSYVTSGISATDIADVHINGITFGTSNYIPVTVDVTQSAQHGQLQFQASAITSTVTLEIAGPRGVTTLNLISGSTADQIRQAINLISDATGVSASFINPSNQNSGVILSTQGYGSSAFVQVDEIGGTTAQPFLSHVFDVDNQQVTRDQGRDITATINGSSTLGQGLSLFLNNRALSVEMRVQEAFNTPGSTSFAITGGGASFQLGPRVDSNQQISIGVQSTTASRLGNDAVGFLTEVSSGGRYSLVDGQSAQAAMIIDEAIRQVSVLRGRLGAFEKNSLDTNVNQLQITMENLTASESSIRDLDFAAEASNLTRAQVLMSAGTSVLAIANQTPQTVLSLLRQ